MAGKHEHPQVRVGQEWSRLVNGDMDGVYAVTAYDASTDDITISRVDTTQYRTPRTVTSFYLTSNFVLTHEVEVEAPAPGPDDGHTFRILATCRGSHKVVGDEHHTDSPDFGDIGFQIEVRAWSLVDAMAEAAKHPLPEWTHVDLDEESQV